MVTSAPPVRYRHAPRVVGRRVHGKMVLVRLTTLEACELNELGGRVWELATSRSSEEITTLVARAVDRDAAEVGSDVERFLDELRRESWVVTS